MNRGTMNVVTCFVMTVVTALCVSAAGKEEVPLAAQGEKLFA